MLSRLKIPPRVEPTPEVKSLFMQVRRGNFGRVADRLEATWGSQTCEDYLKRLIANLDRDSRSGFPKDVFSAVLRLSNLHKAQDAPAPTQGFTFG